MFIHMTGLEAMVGLFDLTIFAYGVAKQCKSQIMTLLLHVANSEVEDAVILKPAHQCYNGIDQVRVAPSAPSRSHSSNVDRRANSLARLAPRGLKQERNGTFCC